MFGLLLIGRIKEHRFVNLGLHFVKRVDEEGEKIKISDEELKQLKIADLKRQLEELNA